ncbi:MAG TPA: non-homologous end-joining DNA ligase [Steroidobacter sp.]|nr:non-homologous end-joining DNA ligase [Steroidobacter sp.]
MKRSLDQYSRKRSFERTPEPAPRPLAQRCGPLLFVVQKHAARRLHYDFRLELDGVLKSWAVPKGPSLNVRDKRMAIETEDHPFDYAAFEGVIPAKQYGAGAVIVWDCGVYSPDEDQEYCFADRARAQQRIRDGLAAGKLSLFLRGEKLKGSFALVRTATPRQWLLIKHKDRCAEQVDVLARARSVLGGYKVEELSPSTPIERIDAERLAATGSPETTPAKLSPMLADSGDAVRSQPGYSYEPKLDGYRIIATLQGGEVRLTSRNGLDMSAVFPEVVADLASQAVESMILDGEVVAFGADGRPSFNALQKRAQLKTRSEIAAARRETPIAMVCFDLLHFAGLNLRNNPHQARRRYLAQCLLPSAHLQLIHSTQDAETLYAAALDSGFEGIVAKRGDSPYQPGRRSSAWRKIKAVDTAEFVIGGYTSGKGAREPIGALLLGYWRDSELHYVGRAGSGLTDQIVRELQARFAGLARKQSPFATQPPLDRPTKWLDPQLVVEVSYQDRTPDGMLRAPVFMRMRDDVAPRSVRKAPLQRGLASRATPAPASETEEVLQQLERSAAQMQLRVGEAQIRLTNLDREYWPANPRSGEPAVSKRDLLRYLTRVSPYMLPHLRDRPLTMIRMPEGIHGERFFQKHWEHRLPEFAASVTIFSEHNDERRDYILVNDLPTLLWLGQVGTLEFHVWSSRASVGPDAVSRSTDYASSLQALEGSVLNYPDYLVFDIDPYIYSGKEAPGAEPELNKRGFSVGKRVAFWLHALLREMSLEAVVKTSGKTGLHVFVPIERTVTFDQAREICEMVGRHLMREHPSEITMEWAVVKRTGKIFMDYNMNVRGKTLNVAYSPRGVAGAPVSMPLTWEELEASEPGDFTMRNVMARLERTGDRWQDVLTSKQNLGKL